MKFYRVEPLLEGEYVVQRRVWMIWRALRIYNNRSDALMHLSSLNEGNLRSSEKQAYKIKQWIAKWRG